MRRPVGCVRSCSAARSIRTFHRCSEERLRHVTDELRQLSAEACTGVCITPSVHLWIMTGHLISHIYNV